MIVQTVQGAFMMIEYEIQNSYGTLLFSFVFFNVIFRIKYFSHEINLKAAQYLFSIARNTFARVLCLVVAMGTGIMATPHLREKKPRIILLTVLYILTELAYDIAVYMNKITPISSQWQLGVSLPLSITNSIYFFWIVRSLEVTEKTLKQTEQHVKFTMIRRFYHILVLCYLISLSAVILEIYVRTSFDFSKQWHYQWIIEASWFSIFSLFQLAICLLMRPTAKTPVLYPLGV